MIENIRKILIKKIEIIAHTNLSEQQDRFRRGQSTLDSRECLKINIVKRTLGSFIVIRYSTITDKCLRVVNLTWPSNSGKIFSKQSWKDGCHSINNTMLKFFKVPWFDGADFTF
jgi:hypothetical protein